MDISVGTVDVNPHAVDLSGTVQRIPCSTRKTKRPHLAVTLIFNLHGTPFILLGRNSSPLALSRGRELHTGASSPTFEGRNCCKHKMTPKSLISLLGSVFLQLSVTDTAWPIAWSLKSHLHGF